MNYEPTNWQTGDLITAGKLNHLEQGIAAFYPQETIIAPEQTVTLTSETTLQDGEPIAIDPAFSVPFDVEIGWTVIVNGVQLEYIRGAYQGLIDDGVGASVRVVHSQGDGPNVLRLVVARTSTPPSIEVGDYTVVISKHVIPNTVLITSLADSLGVSYNEIVAAFLAGKQIWLNEGGGVYRLSGFYKDSNEYGIIFSVPNDGGIFIANGPDEDPVRQTT